ncbi:hypothetical protein D3C79_822890 [compost metagenome]
MARHLQQLAGTVVGGQHFTVQAQRQQAMPGAVEVLRAAVEGQHQLLRVAQAKHTAFDVAGRQHQRRQAVLWLRHHPFTGDVEHADHLAARVAQGYRSAGERAEAVEVMFAAVDQGRPAFHHCRADGIGATQ